MGAALRTVDLIEMLQRELELPGQRFDSGSQFTIAQGCELVEQRLNDGGVKDDHDELERYPGKGAELARKTRCSAENIT